MLDQDHPITGIKLDPSSSVPIYRQIAEGIKAAAINGRVVPGHRLPTTREMARALGVNRNTVVAAYASLADEGWARGRTGKGTFLVPPQPAPGDAPTAAAGDPSAAWTTGFSRAVEGPGVGSLLSFFQKAIDTQGISFSGSYPAAALMPVEEFMHAMRTAVAEQGASLLTYGPTAGVQSLREAIALLMQERGSFTTPDEILVTQGAQQAIDLVFHAFLDRGDSVVIEEPTYTGALSVLGSLGARVIGVPVDDGGLRTDLLAAVLERHRPRIIYVQPTYHNPTTGVLGEARRRELLALAERYRCLIVEDDWAAGLHYDAQPPPSLHAIDGGRHVIYLSTFSKCLLPGLRVGWIAAPGPVMERLVVLKQLRDCGSSPLLQAALGVFLREGGLTAHLRRILPAYRERRDAMLTALDRELPAGARSTRPSGGLFVWVTLPRGFDGRELYAAARAQRVAYSQGEAFHGREEGGHHLRLTFSAVAPEQIVSGVATLGALIRERWPEGQVGPTRHAVEAVPIL